MKKQIEWGENKKRAEEEIMKEVDIHLGKSYKYVKTEDKCNGGKFYLTFPIRF